MTRNRRISSTKRKGTQKPTKRIESVLIYGFHPVLAALHNPARKKRRLWITSEARNTLSKERSPETENSAIDWRTASRQEIDAMLTRGAVHQGLCLECDPLPSPSLAQACKPDDNCAPILLLDQLSDPHNVGAILRSAAAFGVRAVVLQERHSPTATGTLAKAASGALETVPLVRITNLARTMDQLKDLGYWLTGLDAKAGAPIGHASWHHPVALVLGSEGYGLRRITRKNCDSLIAIKLANSMHSLNVSNAAAVALYVLQKDNFI